MYCPASHRKVIATIQAALDGRHHAYAPATSDGRGANRDAEIGEALKGVAREEKKLGLLVIGEIRALRDSATGCGGVECAPVACKNFLAYSMQRLGLDHIDIYRPRGL